MLKKHTGNARKRVIAEAEKVFNDPNIIGQRCRDDCPLIIDGKCSFDGQKIKLGEPCLHPDPDAITSIEKG